MNRLRVAYFENHSTIYISRINESKEIKLLIKLSDYLTVNKFCLELFRSWYQGNCLKWTWMYFKINVILIQDFHSHLSVTEVAGYLCGTWDPSRQRKFYNTYLPLIIFFIMNLLLMKIKFSTHSVYLWHFGIWKYTSIF